LVAEWLATGEGRQNVPKEPITASRAVLVKIKDTGERRTVELTTEALKIAKAFMEMDIDDRREVMQKVHTLEIKRKALKGRGVPDGELGHLARTDTPEGKALAAAAKKRVSRHSN
jgi:hypothetical protein